MEKSGEKNGKGRRICHNHAYNRAIREIGRFQIKKGNFGKGKFGLSDLKENTKRNAKL